MLGMPNIAIADEKVADVILRKFPSLGVPTVFMLTAFGAASDKNFIKMTFPFQWRRLAKLQPYVVGVVLHMSGVQINGVGVSVVWYIIIKY